jgi:hypothetical protein
MDPLWQRARRIARGKLAAWAGGGHADAGPGFELEPPPDATDAARACAREVLEVGPRAGADEIRSAYRRLCRLYHPTRFDGDAARSRAANELLAEIDAAYALLREPREPT